MVDTVIIAIRLKTYWNSKRIAVLDRERFHSLARAEVALTKFAGYYNHHRLSGALGWLTPAERYNGTPFTDQGFQNIPSLAHLQDWLEEMLRAA